MMRDISNREIMKIFWLIIIEKGSSEIRRISAVDGNQKQVWDLEALKINGGITDANFTFIPPKDAEIIDLR